MSEALPSTDRVVVADRAILIYATVGGVRTLVNVLGCLLPSEEAALRAEAALMK